VTWAHGGNLHLMRNSSSALTKSSRNLWNFEQGTHGSERTRIMMPISSSDHALALSRTSKASTKSPTAQWLHIVANLSGSSWHKVTHIQTENSNVRKHWSRKSNHFAKRHSRSKKPNGHGVDSIATIMWCTRVVWIIWQGRRMKQVRDSWNESYQQSKNDK
jgi:hypothetical protein